MTIPVSVFTGFLGAGKTTTILKLIPQLPQDYQMVLLKNEFGDVKVDSELAKSSSLAVTEMLNGCLCCVLVGQMKNALLEIKEMNPDRIIIETSGSAFPGPIAWQIRQIEEDGFKLDSIVTVVDAENFEGYEDQSYTAKLQAQYTDLIVINKHEHVSEQRLDSVIDRVNDLNTDTPRVLSTNGAVAPDLIFGLDTKLFSILNDTNIIPYHQSAEVDIYTVEKRGVDPVDRAEFDAALDTLSKEDFYRVKGFVRFPDGMYILNHAFGRREYHPIANYEKCVSMLLTFMGQDFFRHQDHVKRVFRLDEGELDFHRAKRIDH
eukprot:Clim_evm247s157 gene=Clim_evmTU247s157